MQPFIQHPEYRADKLERAPAPDDFARHYSVSRLWRVKRGKLSATAAADNRTVFSLRYGDISLRGIAISGTYHYTAQFSADTMTAIEGGVRLFHRGDKPRLPGYSLPLNKPVPLGEYRSMSGERERWLLPRLDQTLDIVEIEDGFSLRLETEGGLDGIPIEIECTFEGPGEWETDNTVLQVDNGQTAILKSGYGTFHNKAQGITIGPGSGDHRHWQMRASQPDLTSFRVLVELLTPVDHALEIRYGAWAPAALQSSAGS